MKYTFEIMKEYVDAFKGISVYSVSEDKKLMVDFVAREELEDAQKEIDEAYQRGLDDAWEAARKIVCDESFDSSTLMHIFNRRSSFDGIFGSFSASEAIAKLKAYEEKKEEDDIKVGDELEHTVSGYTSKAIFLEKIGNDEDEDWYKCLFWTGCGVAILSYPKRQFKRTGKHYDIDKILKELRT